MQNKGLIYMLAIVACIAFFISLIGFSVNSKAPTSFTLESYSSGAKVFFKGEPLGNTPLKLDEAFFEKHDIDARNANIFRLFTPKPDGIEILQKTAKTAIKDRQPALLSFEIPTKTGAIPARFNKTGSEGLDDYKSAKICAFVSHELTGRMIVSFDLNKLAPLDDITKAQATLVLFVPMNKEVPLSHMSEYKTFKRVSTSPEK